MKQLKPGTDIIYTHDDEFICSPFFNDKFLLPRNLIQIGPTPAVQAVVDKNKGCIITLVPSPRKCVHTFSDI